VAEFTKEQLIEDLRKLGVVEGDHLGIGLSFKSIGTAVGGPNTLVDALLEAVGPEGTIMMPANTRSYPLYLIESFEKPINRNIYILLIL
jgi:aminoglycoside 3-N-acetyltransferase